VDIQLTVKNRIYPKRKKKKRIVLDALPREQRIYLQFWETGSAERKKNGEATLRREGMKKDIEPDLEHPFRGHPAGILRQCCNRG
jgi:hypothetical protein